MSKEEIAKKYLKSDKDKLEKKLAHTLLYQHGIVKEQEEILKLAEMKKNELIVRRDSAKKKLEEYVSKKQFDEEYKDIKWEYESCLEGIDSLNKTITICEESIAEVELELDRILD